jgi:hypothetical protein
VRLEPHHKALPVGTVSAVSVVLNSECPYELFFGFVGEQKTTTVRFFQHFIVGGPVFPLTSDEETISSCHS